jgi:hypothetical protein
MDKDCKVWNFIRNLNKSRRLILRNEETERQETYEGRKYFEMIIFWKAQIF